MTADALRAAVLDLLTEAYDGPQDPEMTWFANNEPDSGLLGAVRHLSAEQASAKPPGAANSIAAHVEHLRFGLEVGLAFARGEDPKADWDESWRIQTVDAAGWDAVRRRAEDAYRRTLEWVRSRETFENPMAIRGFMAAAAHTAYHLGAIRQLRAALGVK